MNLEFLILWLAVLFPLVYSPGPGNILCAVCGAANTFRGAAPFILGLDVVYTTYAVLMGLGLGAVIQRHPPAFTALQFAGVLYLLYLAYSFYARSAGGDKQEARRLTFKDGLISQALNIKGVSIIALMYSQFIDPAQNIPAQVALLSAMLLALNLFTHFS